MQLRVDARGQGGDKAPEAQGGGWSMQTVLVANRKGGCGKTMTAVTLASALAGDGHRVALADADPQKSALRWLKRRSGEDPEIVGVDWTRSGKIGDVPKRCDWLVIDAPGALRDDRAEALIAEAKAVISPVLPSVFDEDSTKRFLRDIEDIKRVRKGKVGVHLVANRVRPQLKATARLQAFFGGLGQQPLAWIGDRAAYSDLAEVGLAVFDRPQKQFEPMRAQWRPVLEVLGS